MVKRLLSTTYAIFSLILIMIITTVFQTVGASTPHEVHDSIIREDTRNPAEILSERDLLSDSSPPQSQVVYSRIGHEVPSDPILTPPAKPQNSFFRINQHGFGWQTILVIIGILLVSLIVLVLLLIKNLQARKETQKSEERFKALLVASPSAVMIFQHYKLIYVNKALEELTGYSSDELLKMEIWQLIHPNSLRNLNNDSILTDPANFSFRGEFQIVTKSKEKKWIDFSTRSIELDGKHAMLASAIDITQKKNYEKQLIEAEERYALIVLATNDGISDYDIPEERLYLSPQWKEMLGFNDQELENVMQTWYDRVFEQDRDKVIKIIENLKGGAYPSFKTEYRMLCKDGSSIWVAASFSVVFNSEKHPIRILGTHTDITERKITEQKLKESELRYKSFFDHNSAVMLMLEPDSGNIMDANQSAVDFYGYSRDQLLQMHLSEISDMSQEQIDQEFALAKEEQRNYYYFRHKLSDGHVRDVEVYSSHIRISDKNLQYAIVFDITQRRKAEKELQAAKEVAEEANRIKSMFVSSVSHEIRTPLNAIIGLADLIIEEENLTKGQLENVRSIKYSSDHLLDVINEVLDFSKLEAGKVELEKTEFDIITLVRESVKTIEFKARQKNIALRVEMEPGIPRVLIGDPARLRQILLNLLSNAVKFTSQGQVDVHVTVQKLEQEQLSLRFAVSDTGIGIPEEQQEYIFESFSQAGSDTTRKFGGTGLGLSICKKLVELQKGKIGVKSIEGMGSTFWFELDYPVSPKPHLPQLGKPGGKLKNLKGVRILLVEDDKMNQFVMKQILGKWQAEIEIAENGRLAVEILEKEKFSLVLMDLHMPELNGYEAARIIRDPSSRVLDHEVPIIALTADVTMETRQRVNKAGMNDFITKPSEQEVMYEKIMHSIIHHKNKFNPKEEPVEQQRETLFSHSEKAKLRIKKALADIFDDDLPSTLDLINKFLKEIPRTIIGINEAFYENDFETLGKLVHKIKPGFSYMGFTEVSDKITRIQQLARHNKRIAELENLCKELDDHSREIIRILREIQKEFIKTDSVDAPPRA